MRTFINLEVKRVATGSVSEIHRTTLLAKVLKQTLFGNVKFFSTVPVEI